MKYIVIDALNAPIKKLTLDEFIQTVLLSDTKHSLASFHINTHKIAEYIPKHLIAALKVKDGTQPYVSEKSIIVSSKIAINYQTIYWVNFFKSLKNLLEHLEENQIPHTLSIFRDSINEFTLINNTKDYKSIVRNDRYFLGAINLNTLEELKRAELKRRALEKSSILCMYTLPETKKYVLKYSLGD